MAYTGRCRFQLYIVVLPSMASLWPLDNCATINCLHAIDEAMSFFPLKGGVAAREEHQDDEYCYNTLADEPQHMSWSRP
jgi:hypothetical protein